MGCRRRGTSSRFDDHVLAIHANDIKDASQGVLDTTSLQIFDSLAAKSWALGLATEAATTVLRVDSIIMSRPAGGPKVPQQSGNWDEDD